MKKMLLYLLITTVFTAVAAAPAFAGHRRHGHYGGTPIYSHYNVPACAVNPWLCGGPLYTNPYWGGGYYDYNAPIVVPIDLGGGTFNGSLSDAVGGIVYETARIPGRAVTGVVGGLVDGFTGNNRLQPSRTAYDQPAEREVIREVVREVPQEQERVEQQPPQQIINNNYYYGSQEPVAKPKAKKVKKRYVVEVSEIQYVDLSKRRK